MVHPWHAVLPDEPIAREIPVTWGASPAVFFERVALLRARLAAAARGEPGANVADPPPGGSVRETVEGSNREGSEGPRGAA